MKNVFVGLLLIGLFGNSLFGKSPHDEKAELFGIECNGWVVFGSPTKDGTYDKLESCKIKFHVLHEGPTTIGYKLRIDYQYTKNSKWRNTKLGHDEPVDPNNTYSEGTRYLGKNYFGEDVYHTIYSFPSDAYYKAEVSMYDNNVPVKLTFE